MRWHCARDHYFVSERGPRPQTFDSFGAWLFDQVWHAPLWVRDWLVETGFIDDTGPYTLCFWRWDFWNSSLAERLRADDQREWERKRAAAIARWGEGAG